MEYDGDNINRRDEVLSRFRESLTRPMSERYYEEDELIDVFDYAGDIGDDYLRIEALMCASRFYPDSETLRERKAIFYSQYSDDASDKYIEDNQESSGMMWDIMRARQAAPESEEERKSILDRILNDYDDYTDEEVIQLIDLASKFGLMQWVKDNLPRLRDKVEYTNILLYEIAVAADANRDVQTSVKMLEELTEEEPYNVYFWLMLAKEYASLDEGEKALVAIDYALAINPEDQPSLFTKAKLLYVNDKPVDDVIELLKHLLSLHPDHQEAVRLLSNVYSDQDNKIMASGVLNEYIRRYPDQGAALIPDLVVYRPSNIDALLDIFYKSNEENPQVMWATWAHQLAQYGYADVGNKILEAYQRNSGEKIYSIFPIEHLFYQQRFVEAIEAMSEYLESNEDTELNFPAMVIIHLMSMVRLGEYDKAREFCIFFERTVDKHRASNISSRLELIGLQDIIRQIKNRLKRTTAPEDWETYDPLGVWRQE